MSRGDSAASAVTRLNGTFSVIARRAFALAMTTFVSKATVSLMPAARETSHAKVRCSTGGVYGHVRSKPASVVLQGPAVAVSAV